ncbi:hypothetical protein LX36DRAFT_345715 [Colletotrichum falcatum]|nr:hypothetical protein LX36DRAFT_345715 [Colletotrichum falcatum]
MHRRPRTPLQSQRSQQAQRPPALIVLLLQTTQTPPFSLAKTPPKTLPFPGRASTLFRHFPGMSSTAAQQGSVSADTPTARTGITSHEARGQRDARIQTFLSDQTLRLVHPTVASQQRSSLLAAAAVADIDRLGLGSSGAGTGGAVGQPVNVVPLILRGAGSQFVDQDSQRHYQNASQCRA